MPPEKIEAAFAFIKNHVERFGFAPTVRDIAEAAGYKSSRSGLQLVLALERQGRIHRDMTQERKIHLGDRH